MRAAPALNVTVVRGGVWRVIVAACAATSAAALAAWLAERLILPQAMAAIVALASAALAFALAWRGSNLCPLELRFDGERWHVGKDAGAWQGQVAAVIDLGGFVLLRFEPDAPAAPGWPRWLPLERRPIDTHWHALRCAVYSPRAGTDASAPSDPA